MSTITENLNTIKNSIARMKTALNLPANTPLEDVTTNVEQGGGGSVKSNIYKVSTIAERDAISDMVEGDMCVVHSYEINNMTVDSHVMSITLPEIVVLPVAVTASSYVTLRSEDGRDYIDLMLSATSMRFRNMGASYINISYTSTDGITYTKSSAEETVTFSSPVYCYYSEEWSDVFGYFLQVETLEFPGLFTYSNNAWRYSDIGIKTLASQVLTGNKFYGNSGTLTGTRDLNKYLERFYTISEQEPEDTSLMWIQLKDGFYNDTYLGYNLTEGTSKRMFFSTKDTSNTNILEGISKIPKAQGNDVQFQRGKYVYYYKRQSNSTLNNELYRLDLVTGENILWATHPNIYYDCAPGAYDGDKYLYVMDGHDEARTTSGTSIWRLDLDTQTWTKIATIPVTFSANGSLYFAYDPLNNWLHVSGRYSSVWRYYKYYINSSSWSSYTTSADFPSNLTQITYTIYKDSNTQVFIGSARACPYVCTTGASLVKKDFKFRTPTGIINVTPSIVCSCGNGFITKINRTFYYTEFEYDKTAGETFVTVSKALSLTSFSSFGTYSFYGYLDTTSNILYFLTSGTPECLYGKITNFSLEPTCITEPCLEFIIDSDNVIDATGFEPVRMFKHLLKKVRIVGTAASTTETTPSVYGDTHNIVRSAKIHNGTEWITIYENED